MISTIIKCGLILMCVWSSTVLSVLHYTSWPGVVRTYPGQPAELRWTFNVSLNNISWGKIELVYSKMPPLIVYTRVSPDIVTWHKDYQTRTSVTYPDNSRTLSVELSGVNILDTGGHYQCSIVAGGRFVNNEQARIFVYGSPAEPTISTDPATAVEQETLKLICSSTTTSTPRDLAPNMTYTWTLDDHDLPPRHKVSGDYGEKLTINPVLRGDDGNVYKCLVRETGSSLDNINHRTIKVEYGPSHLNLTNPGPITVTEGDHVTVSCTSDCSPVCSFRWTRSNDSTWSHDSQVLEIPDISRDKHDTYTCKANNTHGSRDVSLNINVKYATEIVSFGPTGGSIHGDPEALMCDVTSRPESDIDIRNTSTELVQSEGYQAVYTFRPVSVLDSGLYQCGAGNDVGPRAVRNITLEVKGGFHLCTNQSTSIKRGKALNSNITEEICQFANPFLEVTEVNWTFVPRNISLRSDESLPEDTFTTTGSTRHKYRKIIKLHITRLSEGHFGKYTLTTNNGQGMGVMFTLILVPDSPPEAPTHFKCTRTTAVSIYLQWIPGFDGGFEQTFWVELTNTDSSDTFGLRNISDSEDGVIKYKLTSEDGVQPSQTYKIQIGAYNLKGNTSGPSTTNNTKDQPQFLEEIPDIRIEDSKAYIKWSVSALDTVTHLLVRSCDTDDRDNCVHTNVTDPSTQPYVVTLPEASSFTFWFVFFDEEDIVYSPPAYVHKVTASRHLGVIVGVVVGCFVLICGVIIVIILWRKNVLRPKDKSLMEQSNVSDMETSTVSNNTIDVVNGEICDISPYGTSKDTLAVTPQQQKSSSSTQSREGDVYAMVDKPKKKTDIYSEVKKTRKQTVRMEVDMKTENKDRPKSVYPPKTEQKLKDNNKGVREEQYENFDLKERDDKSYVNVIESTGTDGPYSEVNISRHNEQQRHPTKMAGDDGVTYADLDHFTPNRGKTIQNEIHGSENRTEYASIDIAKLRMK